MAKVSCTDNSSTEFTTEKYYQIMHRLIELESNTEKKPHKEYGIFRIYYHKYLF